MSFDLYVWHESESITADDARIKLERWADGQPDVFDAHSRVPALRAALLEMFPPLENLSIDDIDDLGVWSYTPEPSDYVLAISCVWSRADEVGSAVLRLAAEHGLVCYEPGFHVLNPNAPGYAPPFTLSSAVSPTVPDPDDKRLDWTVRRLSAGDFYAVLERADGWYAQVGYGRSAGVPTGTYALEHREGSAERHFRTETTDVVEAVRFFQEFRAGTDEWRRRHVWRPLG
ncbi:hypothetical protein [Catellatospora tritici]|uniref:hypothetical protein n=1 Tax=Catellatospora tritici TaxID=2851566 RepID=UPI001C2D2D2B|nr:hypothetical protein [Catellatospora tritici]MBV1849443.1 hypothetical protein [Catellatospora tritici]MBV1854015.1 hypothetical protein [Catellatospora tritici]